MVRRSSSDYSYIDGYSQGRTPNDVVWGSTKAKDLVSSVRFSWDNKHQKIFFVRFLAKEGLNYKNADVTPLLRTLNLDGYEDIKNFNGDNVHDIIVEKVRRKLASTVSELDPDFLFKASLGPQLDKNTLYKGERHSRGTTGGEPPRRLLTAGGAGSTSRTSIPNPSPLRESMSPGDVANDTEESTQRSHSFLKMPKPKATALSRTSEVNTKREQSDDAERSPRVKSEPSTSSDRQTPGQPPASVAGPSIAERRRLAKQNRAQQSLDRFFSCLPDLDDALKEVEEAFEDLPQARDGENTWNAIRLIRNMRSSFFDVQIEATETEEEFLAIFEG